MNSSDNSKFEFFYSIFMLIFGIGVILCFLVALGFAFYIFSFGLLYYLWPIIIGLWIGIFRSGGKGYEKELTGEDGKKIHKIIDIICEKTGQKKPHRIVVTEGSSVAVTGFFRKKIIIGMVAIKFMDEKELLAILAHEYGHFAHKDTVLGYITYRIQHFIEVQREINKQNMASLFFFIFVPTWFFFWLFSKYYSLISMWYSRRVEFRADNFASNIVGAQRYANTLVKYCIISDIFESVVPKYVIHYLNQDKQIINLYEFIKPLYADGKNIEIGLNEVLSARSSWWSTHPSISERTEALGIKSVEIHVEKEFKSILNNQTEYEKEGSKVMTHKMAYWMHLVAVAQAQKKQEEEKKKEGVWASFKDVYNQK